MDTEAVELVTVFPLLSSIATVTAGVIAALGGVAEGCAKKTSFDAVPGVMLNSALVALVRDGLVAERL
jgi:hypothetical protein